jgi:hypothetical protein
MKEYWKRIALSLSTGYVFCYFGELVFWATPCREGMTIPEVGITWLLYSFFAYVFLCIVSVFRVRSLPAVFLAGAFFGWYEEGIFMQTMYGTPDGPFPMSISFTGLAWHATIDVCVGWLFVRKALARGRGTEIAGLAALIGTFYGLWAIWWLAEPPEPMRLLLAAERTDIVFIHFCLFAFSSTGILVLAYWIHNHLTPLRFKPTRGELWLMGIITALYYVFVTIPANPRTIWVLPPLMGITLWALNLNRRREYRVDSISAFSSRAKPFHYMLLFLIPLVASVIYFVGLAAELRLRTNVIAYYTLGIAGAVFWFASVAQSFFRKKVNQAEPQAAIYEN